MKLIQSICKVAVLIILIGMWVESNSYEVTWEGSVLGMFLGLYMAAKVGEYYT